MAMKQGEPVGLFLKRLIQHAFSAELRYVIFKILEQEPTLGQRVSAFDQAWLDLHRWYKQLSEEEQRLVRTLMVLSVRSVLFSVCYVIDELSDRGSILDLPEEEDVECALEIFLRVFEGNDAEVATDVGRPLKLNGECIWHDVVDGFVIKECLDQGWDDYAQLFLSLSYDPEEELRHYRGDWKEAVDFLVMWMFKDEA